MNTGNEQKYKQHTGLNKRTILTEDVLTFMVFQGEPFRVVKIHPHSNESIRQKPVRKPWRGVTCYPRRNFDEFDSDPDHLRYFLGSPGGDAAPALVEACCEPDSLMSRPTKWSEGREIIQITEDIDITSRKGIEMAKAAIKGPNDALWLSSPCVGGSQLIFLNWLRGESTRLRIRGHWALFHKI